MPTRLIREGILTSDAVNALEAKDEVFYRRLMSIVDDYGRYDARPAILRAVLFPLQLDRIRESDVARGLAACEKASLIRCYEVEGKPYLQLERFGQQTRSAPKWPDPPTDSECKQLLSTDNSCKQLKTVAHLDGCGVEGGGEGEGEGATPQPPKGGGVRGSPEPVFPNPLDTHEFRGAWERWLAYRREYRLVKWKDSTVNNNLKKLAEVGHDAAIESINTAINATWKGLFPAKASTAGAGGSGQTPQGRADQRRKAQQARECQPDQEPETAESRPF